MALPKELQDIVDELEYENDDERAAFEKILEGKAGAKIKAGYMKNADYTTKTSAVAQAKKDLEAAQAKFNEEQDYVLSTTATWKQDMETRLNAALKQTAEGDLRGAALTSKLRALAAQYGEDPDELLKDVQGQRVTDDKPKDAPTYDRDALSRDFVSQKKFDETAQSVFGFAPMIRDFEREYKKKFGQEYDGSITELVRDVLPEVEKQRARGRNVDLFGLMKEKLDFAGQDVRNTEAAKVAAEAERTKWEEEKRKEIEANVRSEYLASNPSAMRKPDESEKWRESLTAKDRGNSAAHTQQDDFNRRKELHQVFEKKVAEAEGKVA